MLYTNDLMIAKAIINRDENITRQYFYKQCYPLFKSIFDHYYTDCGSCIEFINEIYIITLTPSKTSGKCQMENFRGDSTLACWLKSAALFYCYKKYERKQNLSTIDILPNPDDEKYDGTDRFLNLGESINLDISEVNRTDVEKILDSMPNKRYGKLIRLRYLEQYSNEETAEALCMTMDNYYNVHKRAKAQYEVICKKESFYE